MDSLKWTGERIIPENGRYMFERHLIVYKFANDFCKNKKVLDAGCGEGYGSCFISGNANEVIGVDVSYEAIQHAQKKYKRNNLKFERMSVQNLKFMNETFDAVLSFQVIEHLNDVNKFLNEIKKVLKKDGVAIISTPNRALCKGNGNNEYHTQEYGYDEYIELLNNGLGPTDFYGVQLKSGKYSGLKLIDLISILDIFKIRRLFPTKLRRSALMTMEKKIELEIVNTKLNTALDFIGLYRKT